MGKVISFEEFEAEKHLKQFTHFYDAYLDLVDHLEFSEINLFDFMSKKLKGLKK